MNTKTFDVEVPKLEEAAVAEMGKAYHEKLLELVREDKANQVRRGEFHKIVITPALHLTRPELEHLINKMKEILPLFQVACHSTEPGNGYTEVVK